MASSVLSAASGVVFTAHLETEEAHSDMVIRKEEWSPEVTTVQDRGRHIGYGLHGFLKVFLFSNRFQKFSLRKKKVPLINIGCMVWCRTWVSPPKSSEMAADGDNPLEAAAIAKECPELLILVAKFDAAILTSTLSLSRSDRLGLWEGGAEIQAGNGGVKGWRKGCGGRG